MDIIHEFIQVIIECFVRFITDDINIRDKATLLRKIALLLGIIASSCLLGWLSYKSATLWNKKVRYIPAYWLLSLFSFFITLIFITSFFSLHYLREVSINRAEQWKDNIQTNKVWQEDTFRKAYYAVKQQGEEDFSQHPAPEEGGRIIPVAKESSRRITAKIYVNQAIEQFKKNHPYLSLILKADLDIPEEKIYQDNVKFFKDNPAQTYNLDNAVKIAANELKMSLEQRIPPLIKTSRLFISVIYICIIFLVFIIIGVLSHRDIKIFH